ncbi:MAG: CocE/NonD family hydrolase [Gemmatimonadetes bacterium]|nr:CocE/NonD family hydrolase [Gemmatimonadota bacterium]
MYVFEWYPFIYPGGVFRDDFFTQWQRLTKGLDSGARFTWGPLRFDGVAPVDGPDGRLLRDSAIAAHRVNRDMLEMWRGVPYRNSRDSISRKPIHQERGPATYLAQINASGVAVYGLAGWFDAFPRDALLWHENLTVPRKLVMGPWFHGETTGFDLATERLRWFDHWLKGIDNGIMREPPIRYFVIDAPAGEQWRTARRWPIAEARATVFHFGARSRGERLTPTCWPARGAASRHAARRPDGDRGTRHPMGPPRTAARAAIPIWRPTTPKGSPTTEALAAPVEVIGHPSSTSGWRRRQATSTRSSTGGCCS